MKGFVYIMCNKGMPNLCKIGFTLKDPELRAADLANTGSPYPYEVVYYAFVDEPQNIEQLAHQKLSYCRAGKEWFKSTIETCITTIKESCSNIYYEFSQPFISISEIEEKIENEKIARRNETQRVLLIKERNEEIFKKIKHLENEKQNITVEINDIMKENPYTVPKVSYKYFLFISVFISIFMYLGLRLLHVYISDERGVIINIILALLSIALSYSFLSSAAENHSKKLMDSIEKKKNTIEDLNTKIKNAHALLQSI